MSFLTSIQKSSASNIWLLRVKDSQNQPCYFYVLVDSVKAPLVGRKQTGDAVTPSQLGTVIASGWGEPSVEIIEEMREKYGFEAA